MNRIRKVYRGFQDLSGSTTKKYLFFVCLPLQTKHVKTERQIDRGVRVGWDQEDRQDDKQKDGQIERQIDRQRDRWIDRETDRQTERQDEGVFRSLFALLVSTQFKYNKLFLTPLNWVLNCLNFKIIIA